MQSVTEVASIKDVAIERLNWSRQFALALLTAVPDDKVTARAGGKGNHALWVMGHIAASEDSLRAAASGQPTVLPEKLHKLFAGGTTPSDRAVDYPSRQELTAAMQTSRDAVILWVRSLDEESAFRPTPDSVKPFAPNAISTPLGMVAHELFHAGQVASVRASMELPRIMR